MGQIKKIIKNIIPNSAQKKLRIINSKYSKVKLNKTFDPIISELKSTKNQKRIILIGTAIYGNIGDHAISIAGTKFIKKEFPNVNLIEIPISLYEYKSDIINRNINQHDLIIINGGGYLGTLWETGQEISNSIIINNPNNRIIIFPQTMYYKEDSENLIKEHKKIIADHPNVSLIVRDKKSYDFVSEKEFEFKKVILTPDIVTYIDGNKYKNNKNKIIFVLRKDHEKVDYKKDIEELKSHFIELGYEEDDFEYTDSVVEGYYNLYNRDALVEEYLKMIGQASFVISDRLHGMILAAICGIPVIALDNVSNKVYGAYEWFSSFDYVLYFKDKNIYQKIDEINESKSSYNYDSSKFANKHQEIKKLVELEYNDLKI
ncbi:polysaccharide pyruvyl transferase family protein [Fundicoccus culcitae]|uniref:Polysaccharide pyruvyl transferase family protein n=1 Tax=Fundicoccus culcitae TaxID=2969821 RepID=A0ABY5P9X8_9LACT|nr:polysaccharide pyruvyl transferase family protein [Fundicoccus culcitae]UUX35238.1 polysaccharide pyruvyl transferase family protein [Fundicoccus culcitae]